MAIANDISAPLRHADRFFIGGEWVKPSSDAVIDVIDSTSEQLFFSVAEAKEPDMARAVAAARQAFDKGPWPRLSHEQRAEYLRAIATALEGRTEDLGQIWPRESGVLHAVAKGSVAGAVGDVQLLRRAGHDVPLRGRGAAQHGWQVRPARPRARRRRGRDHPLERPPRPDQLQNRPRPAGRVHRHPQGLTRSTGRGLRHGGDRRGGRPPSGRPQCRDRRPGGVRAPGARPPRRQDHVHRVDGRPGGRSPPSAGSGSPAAPSSWAASPPPSSSTTWT